MRFEDFQDGHLGGHLRYQKSIILAILNLSVAPMPPINEFNPHYSLGDVVWRISGSWMLEWKQLGSSESPQCLPPSFSFIWLTIREQMVDLRFSRWPPWCTWWILEQNKISNSKYPSHPNATYHSVADMVWRFSRWPPWQPSWNLGYEWNDFSNSESLCCYDVFHQVTAQSEF